MPFFHDFSLQPATLAVLANMEITEPTPIQIEAIPVLLAGNDLVGQSATGSGKTLAYGIPLVERIARNARGTQALVLVPTRELAVQVHAVLAKLATSRRLSTAVLVGGRPYGNQLSALRYGAQIVVGTPGRVKDHLDRGSLVLSQLRMCILDEADQMLDSGFAPAIEEILTTTPDTRQMALFSATIPAWVETLQKKFLKDPVIVNMSPAPGAKSSIEQIAYQVPQDQKIAALCTLLHSTGGESSLVFGKTKYGVEKLGVQLSKLGFTVGTLHGNKSQRAREEVLTAFRRGHVQTLLATNVAARGLDIQDIYQVINYELPESSDLFTHRIGRTGRMGRQGKAITLLVPSDVPKWRRMARNLGQTVALQRLPINDEAIATRSLIRPAAPVAEVQEQYSEQRPVRSRKQFVPVQERGRGVSPRLDSHSVSSLKRRPNESGSNRPATARPAWQAEEMFAPELPYSEKARYGKRGAGTQPSFGRTTDRRKAALPVLAPQQRTNKRKPRATTTASARRTAASHRSAGR